ncbi:MAG: DUF983 domain-containing protein [Hyphomicrobiales bacterium]|nr:DUF983 domain-containing protein [Hyphomicrobiales bacterium]
MSQAPGIAVAPAPRDVAGAVRRGFSRRCPACGEGALFDGYLAVVPACAACGADMTPQRADDAPAYVTIAIVGHVVVAGFLAADEFWPGMPMAAAIALWSAVTVGLSLWLLPRAKGALIGVQWANRMHGFAATPAPPDRAAWR